MFKNKLHNHNRRVFQRIRGIITITNNTEAPNKNETVKSADLQNEGMEQGRMN